MRVTAQRVLQLAASPVIHNVTNADVSVVNFVRRHPN